MHTNRHIDSYIDRKTDSHTDRWSNIQRDKQIDKKSTGIGSRRALTVEVRIIYINIEKCKFAPRGRVRF